MQQRPAALNEAPARCFLKNRRRARRVTSQGTQRKNRRRHRREIRLSIGLFVVTAISVFAAGAFLGEGPVSFVFRTWDSPFRDVIYQQVLADRWDLIRNGFVFAGCLMSILLAHEMGHYLQALRHRIPATPPFFIPFPISPFGTMGAVILQNSRRADRRQMFDIAVSGPLAGLVLAIPITWYGVATSEIVPSTPPSWGVVTYGNPLLIEWLVEWGHRPLAGGEDIRLNAPLFAGWVGLFITGLNLLPVGQLDGGHILYMLIGRRAHAVARWTIYAAFGWMLWTDRFEFLVIILFLLLMGLEHPPTANDRAPLGLSRILLGWLTLAFIVIGFTPTPIVV